jgi:hypothetical protein
MLTLNSNPQTPLGPCRPVMPAARNLKPRQYDQEGLAVFS